MIPSNEKAGSAYGFENNHCKSKYSTKSNAGEAQRSRFVDELPTAPKTSCDLRDLCCDQSAANIRELSDQFGFNIETECVTLDDREGYLHPRAACYHLRGENALEVRIQADTDSDAPDHGE